MTLHFVTILYTIAIDNYKSLQFVTNHYEYTIDFTELQHFVTIVIQKITEGVQGGFGKLLYASVVRKISRQFFRKVFGGKYLGESIFRKVIGGKC